MLCRFCREDLPRESFKERDYNYARVAPSHPACLACLALNQAERNTKERNAASDLRVLFKMAPKLTKSERRALKQAKRAGKKAKVIPVKSARDVQWANATANERMQMQLDGRTTYELRLAAELEKRGVLFAPQHRVGAYFLDFWIQPCLLAVEIDGGYHFTAEQIKKDATRTKTLEDKGWTVLRFTNERILRDMDSVLAEIGDASQIIAPAIAKPKAATPPRFTSKGTDFHFGALADYRDAIARDDLRDRAE